MEAGPDSLPAAVQDMQPAPVPALHGRAALSLALALVASEYLIGTIKLSVHEAGHGWAVMLAGGVYRRMYLSPTLVGYTWWWLPPESLPLEKWITAAGLVGGIGIGLLFMLAAWLERRREGWLPDFLALGGFDEAWRVGEDVDFARRLRAAGRARGLRFGTLWRAHIVTSCRTFDTFGDWHFVRHPGLLWRGVRGVDDGLGDRYFYDYHV